MMGWDEKKIKVRRGGGGGDGDENEHDEKSGFSKDGGVVEEKMKEKG